MKRDESSGGVTFSPFGHEGNGCVELNKGSKTIIIVDIFCVTLAEAKQLRDALSAAIEEGERL